MKKTEKSLAVDEYINFFDQDIASVLNKMRQIIRDAAPFAEEKISYGIPTFYLAENLVHFGGFKNHVGFYPGPGAVAAFEKDLKNYEQAKGSIRFPYGKKLPASLISKMVKYRVAKSQEAADKKTKKARPAPSKGLPALSKPAINTLLYHGIDSLSKLSKYTKKEILSLHGMGPASIPAIEAALKKAGLAFMP